MERDDKQIRRSSEKEERERRAPSSEPKDIKPPFASEGLERVRESHT